MLLLCCGNAHVALMTASMYLIFAVVPMTDTAEFNKLVPETEEPPAPAPPIQLPEDSPAPPEKQEKTSWAGIASRGGSTQAPPSSQPVPPPAQMQVKLWAPSCMYHYHEHALQSSF